MSRFGTTVRTYGRTASNDNASKAFDAVFDSKPSASMTTSTAGRFGKYTFTSSRAKDIEVEPKKRKVEETKDVFDDPFSFDSSGDEGGSKKVKVTQRSATSATGSRVGASGKGKKATAAAAASSTSNGKTVNSVIISRKKKVNDDDEDEFVVRKGPVKSNSSSRNSQTETKSKTTESAKTAATKKKPAVSTGKQLSMDRFAQKLATLSPPQKGLAKDSIFSYNAGKKKTAASKPVVKKFFTSSQDSAGLSDHNYSQSPRTNSSQVDSDNESRGSNCFLLDSDGELDSGDPEIVFNSPKKKAQLDFSSRFGDEHSDTDTTDERVSPTTSVNSNLSEKATKFSLNTGAPKASAIGRDSPASVDSDDNDEALDKFSSFKSKGPSKTYGGNRLLLRKSSSEVMGIGKKADIPTFNMSSSKSVATYGKVNKTASEKITTAEKKFSSLAGRKLEEDESKDKKKAPLVRRLLTSPKKPAARYNARSWNDSDGKPGSSQENKAGLFEDFDFDDEADEEISIVKEKKSEDKLLKDPVSLKRHVTWPSRQGDDAVMSVKVNKDHKELFTVVRNVKQAHEMHEFGETQEFEDDIEYIMEGLGDKSKVSVRCLSCISLVNKCTIPAFRMHLRAHGTMTKVFGALHDAHKYPSLALSTASVLFMLSRDRLNMDLEKSVLELMLQLLNVETNRSSPEKTPAGNKDYSSVMTRVVEVCKKVKADGGARHLHIDNLTAGTLAMEALLSLTSKRAGDWFKEDLRLLGGLDHLIKTISDCVDSMGEFEVDPSEYTVMLFGKVDRCLRVLEQVTFMNAENQSYLITYKSSSLIKSLCRILRMCDNILPFNEVIVDENEKPDKEGVGYIVFTCLTCTLKVLLNLTHDNAVGSSKVGQQQGLVKCILNLILQIPKYVTHDQRFELLVLSLGLFINMVEHCDSNRQMIIDTTVHNSYEAEFAQSSCPALESLVQLFVIRYNTAQILEREQEEEKKKIVSMNPDLDKDGTGSAHPDVPELKPSLQQAAADVSGVWKESESGLEWIASEKKADDTTSTTSSEDDKENGVSNSQEDSEEKLISKVLHKAGRHMEDSITAAYLSLLIGIIIQNNSELVESVRDNLPEGNFDNMILMLKKFLGFMNLTNESRTGNKSIRNVIQILEDC